MRHVQGVTGYGRVRRTMELRVRRAALGGSRGCAGETRTRGWSTTARRAAKSRAAHATIPQKTPVPVLSYRTVLVVLLVDTFRKQGEGLVSTFTHGGTTWRRGRR